MERYLRIHWVLAALLAVSMMGCSKFYNVAELDAGEGRSIFIFAERFYDDTFQPVYYRVEVGGNTVIPDTYISSIDPENTNRLRLRLVSNKNGSLVGVIEEKLPQKIWVIHNFATGETYPRCQSDSSERCEQRGEDLLKELQKDHPGVTFTF